MDPVAKDFLKDAANVVLGWLLGLGSAAGTSWWKDRQRIQSVRKAILGELRQTSLRLLVLVYHLEGRFGRVNRALLEWMQPQIERYSGPNPKDQFLAGVSRLLAGDDTELAAWAAHLKATTKPQFVPREELSYTSASVHEIHVHDPEFSVRVLDILSHLRMLNEARENGIYFSRLTFTPGLTPVDLKKAMINADEAQAQTAYRARVIVDKVTELENKLGK